MLFRSVMIVWCCALTIVAAANHVPTQVAHHNPLLSAAHAFQCDASQFSEASSQGASCSCSKGPISDTIASNGANTTGDPTSPGTTKLSSEVRLSVAVVEESANSHAGEPLEADKTIAASDPEIETALAAHLKQRRSWGRSPSKPNAEVRTRIETAAEVPDAVEIAPSATGFTAQPVNNAIIALSVGGLEDLLRIRENWREQPSRSTMAEAGATAEIALPSKDAVNVRDGIAIDAQPADRARPKTKIEAALAAHLEKRASWGTEPSNSVSDARPLTVARTSPGADGKLEAARAEDTTEDLSAYLARRETWGKRLGSSKRAQQKPVAAQSARVKNWVKQRNKNVSRYRKRRVPVFRQRQPLPAYSRPRTWQERVLFPL